MESHELLFSCKARYFKIGTLTEKTKQVWFVIHGYGQLAEHFIKKFKTLGEHDICVIAPEGLSRFYLEDVTKRMQTGNNRVGATWMTRENRLMDIENYLAYLNALYASEIKIHSIPVSIVGFSQGAATASRWALDGKSDFKRLILWSGVFPPDMNFESGKKILKDKRTILVYGKSDPFLTDNRFTEMKELSQQLEIIPDQIEFDGGHEIHEPTLLSLIN
ncbi:MAG TPA: alpha/beta hydrolase [Ohtaekwangia sp.]